MRLALLFLFALTASAACNRNDTSCGGLTDCPATPGSSTPAVVSGSTWTVGPTTSTVSCLSTQEMDTGRPCSNSALDRLCADIYWPTSNVDLNKVEWWICEHPGGGTIGQRESCFGATTSIAVPVELVQRALHRVNRRGGYGLGIILVDYPLSTGVGNNTFPIQAQAAKCHVSWAVTQLPVLVPGITQPIDHLAIFGISWGGNMAWWGGNLPANFYADPGTCIGGALVAPSNGVVGASMWGVMSGVRPVGNSTYENSTPGSGQNFTTAMNRQLNSTTLSVMQANDLSTHFTAANDIVQANIASLSKNWFFGWGASDTLVPPTWSGGGNLTLTAAQYAALSPPIVPTILSMTGLPSTHTGDSSTGIIAISLNQAYEFLMGPQPSGWLW